MRVSFLLINLWTTSADNLAWYQGSFVCKWPMVTNIVKTINGTTRPHYDTNTRLDWLLSVNNELQLKSWTQTKNTPNLCSHTNELLRIESELRSVTEVAWMLIRHFILVLGVIALKVARVRAEIEFGSFFRCLTTGQGHSALNGFCWFDDFLGQNFFVVWTWVVVGFFFFLFDITFGLDFDAFSSKFISSDFFTGLIVYLF